jgi:dolichyl-phosphate-mannose-protein mannosyltransferase
MTSRSSSSSTSRSTSDRWSFAVAVLIFIYFFWQIHLGLTMLFAPDDMQNLYGYWIDGPLKVFRAVLICATPAYRPMGGLYYLPLFAIFGLNPVPYRIVIFVLLCVNFWLLYAIARRLTSNAMAALFALLIGCVHGNAIGAYFSNSTIYDILCFSFYFGAVLFYIRLRQRGQYLDWRQMLMLALLYICALDSKEMAVAFPVTLLAYELCFHWKWPLVPRQFIPIVITGAMTAIYIAGKLFQPNSLSSFDAYRPVYTAHRFFLNLRAYLDILFLVENRFTSRMAVAFWLAMLLIARVLRSRTMTFGAVLAFASFLPLMFVPTREGFVLYIPLVGFGLYFGELLSILVRPRAAALVVLALLACGLGYVHQQRILDILPFSRHSQTGTIDTIQELKLAKGVKAGDRLLFIDSPWGDDWDMYFIAKLFFHDPTIRVSMLDTGKPIRGDEHDHFDHVFSWFMDVFVQEK